MGVIHFDVAPIDYGGSIITSLDFGTANLFTNIFQFVMKASNHIYVVHNIKNSCVEDKN
jgi:hypothetical protein